MKTVVHVYIHTIFTVGKLPHYVFKQHIQVSMKMHVMSLLVEIYPSMSTDPFGDLRTPHYVSDR